MKNPESITIAVKVKMPLLDLLKWRLLGLHKPDKRKVTIDELIERDRK